MCVALSIGIFHSMKIGTSILFQGCWGWSSHGQPEADLHNRVCQCKEIWVVCTLGQVAFGEGTWALEKALCFSGFCPVLPFRPKDQDGASAQLQHHVRLCSALLWCRAQSNKGSPTWAELPMCLPFFMLLPVLGVHCSCWGAGPRSWFWSCQCCFGLWSASVGMWISSRISSRPG